MTKKITGQFENNKNFCAFASILYFRLKVVQNMFFATGLRKSNTELWLRTGLIFYL